MRSPAKAIHSPLPLFATPTEALGGFNPTAPRIRCIESRIIRRNLRGCHAICCHWKSKSIAQQSAPTAGSQGKANHTPNGIAWQEKPFPGGPSGGGAVRKTRWLGAENPARNCEGHFPVGSGLCRMARQRPPELTPLREQNLKPRRASALDASFFRVERRISHAHLPWGKRLPLENAVPAIWAMQFRCQRARRETPSQFPAKPRFPNHGMAGVSQKTGEFSRDTPNFRRQRFDPCLRRAL